MEEKSVTFQAIFCKAVTLVDGGWRISFDLQEDDGDIIAQIAQLRQSVLQIAVIPIS